MGGFDVTMSYNQANLPVNSRMSYGGKRHAYAMSYYLTGQKYEEKDARSNITKDYGYTSRGQLEYEEWMTASETGMIDYGYDASGNRTQKTEYYYDTSTKEITDYTYDANNRLMQAAITSGVPFSGTEGNLTAMTRYYYDPNGNTLAEQNKVYISNMLNVDTDSEMILSGRSSGKLMKVYEYDDFNRLIKYHDGGKEAEYRYTTDNLRASKTVNGQKTDFVWNGQNLAGETKNDVTTAYTYDMTGVIASKKNGVVTRYVKDPHGNVIGTSKNNELVGEYDYTAFGIELQSSGPLNPFRYCGEYYDTELDSVYLRNRYYNPSTGRFLTEDPVKDGMNWYSYCDGEPLMMVDPMGLFDYNTRLSYAPNTYSADVRTLQNELAWKGYLTDAPIDGFFGDKTLRAVNAYKNDMGLGNSGKDYGVVGLQTWETLGLIYRTQQDIDAGVQIVNAGAKQYFDISEAVNRAVIRATGEFQQHSGEFDWFRNTVGDYGKWNIKRNASVWSQTLGISSNTYYRSKIFYGRPVVVDDIGNITYGYLGTAANFSANTLNAGSLGNHIKNHGFGDWKNEKSDQLCIALGILWYEGYDIQVRFN